MNLVMLKDFITPNLYALSSFSFIDIAYLFIRYPACPSEGFCPEVRATQMQAIFIFFIVLVFAYVLSVELKFLYRKIKDLQE